MAFLEFIKTVTDLCIEIGYVPISGFANMDKRIAFPYLLSSVVIAFFVYRTGTKEKSFLRYLFNKKVWIGNSAKTDYYYVFLNAAVKVLLLGPSMVFSLIMALEVSDWCFRFIGMPSVFVSRFSWIIWYTISLTIFKDFMVYVTHYLMHKISWLWEFHKTHHAATTLSPFTQYRIHPIELVLNNFSSLFAFAIITGLFNYLSQGNLVVYEVLGANALLVVFKFFGANLRHSHVKFKYPSFLENIFISPYQHQIHHSDNPRFFNKNMGSFLAVWDFVFGTLSKSTEISKIKFGLGAGEALKTKGFWSGVFSPFVSVFYKIIQLFK